jgi:hypothetical protein
MRMIVATDLHNSQKNRNWLVGVIEKAKPDLFVFLGDSITVKPVSFSMEFVREALAAAGKMFILPGNMEHRDIVLSWEKLPVMIMHNRTHDFCGFKFVGRGGSIPCPSPTPFEDPDEGFDSLIRPLMDGCDILLLHQPAYGFRDHIVGVGNVGSRTLRKLVEDTKPRLVLSGHIHEAKGMDFWEGVHFINPGALESGNAADIEVDERHVDVTFITNPHA